MQKALLTFAIIFGMMFGNQTAAHSCIFVNAPYTPPMEHLKNADIIFWGRAGNPEIISESDSKLEVVTSFKVVKRQRGLLLGKVKVHWTFNKNKGCARVFEPGHNYYVLAYKKDGKYWTNDELHSYVHVPSKEQLERDKIMAKRMKEIRK